MFYIYIFRTITCTCTILHLPDDALIVLIIYIYRTFLLFYCKTYTRYSPRKVFPLFVSTLFYHIYCRTGLSLEQNLQRILTNRKTCWSAFSKFIETNGVIFKHCNSWSFMLCWINQLSGRGTLRDSQPGRLNFLGYSCVPEVIQNQYYPPCWQPTDPIVLFSTLIMPQVRKTEKDRRQEE